jgi:hypothetical protein
MHLTCTGTGFLKSNVAEPEPVERQLIAGAGAVDFWAGSGSMHINSYKYLYIKNFIITSVADPDPGSGAFLPQGSGIRIRDNFFPDPGSRIPDPYDVPNSRFYL